MWKRRTLPFGVSVVFGAITGCVGLCGGVGFGGLVGLEQTDEPVVVQANSGTSVEATDDTPLQSSEGVDSPSEILSTPTTQEPLESEPFMLQPERRVTVPPELIRPASYQPHRGNF